MPLVIADRVRETSTTVGTGTFTLAGAIPSYQSFSVIGNGNTVYYTIVNQSADEWEVGIGTYTASGTTLSRDTVLSSSNSGSLVNFSAGTKDVWGDYPAGKAVTTDTLAYPPVIGNTTPNAATFTTLTATGQTNLGNSMFGVTPKGTNLGAFEAGPGSYTQEGYLGYTNNSTFAALRFNVRPNTGGAAFAFNTYGTASTPGSQQFQVNHTSNAVNFVQVTGAATGNSPTISGQGSDANVPVTLQTKGTSPFIFQNGNAQRQLRIDGSVNGANHFNILSGASGQSPILRPADQSTDSNVSVVFQSRGTGGISLSTGSIGTNLVNGTTVTVITRTGVGSGYTTAPSVIISAPTTAGGVQATATVPIVGFSPAVSSGGTGYTNGDVLTVSGGTFSGLAMQVTVSAVSGGVITAVTLSRQTDYTVAPSNPVSVTGGTGSGATFNLTWGIGTFTITNAGSGYVEQPTVTFTGGGGTGAAAYARIGTTPVVRSLAQQMDFANAAGNVLRLVDFGGTSTDFFQIQNTPVGGAVFAGVTGSNTNVGLVFYSRGTGNLDLTTNSGTTQLRVAHTASAVNFVQVTGAATGSGPTISAQGSDANAFLAITSKGTSAIRLQTGGTTQVFINNISSAVNTLALSGSTTGNAVQISAQGSDTNIPLVVQPKGTGALQAQLNDGTATGGNARGANAVDWQTLRVAATQVASGAYSTVAGGQRNTAAAGAFVGGGYANGSNAYEGVIVGGSSNASNSFQTFIGGGSSNTANGTLSSAVAGLSNGANGVFNFVGGGFANSGTANAAVTTQSATMNGTTAVTLSASNPNIRVGQFVDGTFMTFPRTYVAAISGTTLTLSQAASGSGTATLSFFTPHGVVVGGGNNQATGAYSFIGGGGDAGTAGNRNVASGDWSFVGGGRANTASGIASFIGGGGYDGGTGISPQTASGQAAFIGGGLSNFNSAYAGVVAGGFSNTVSTTASTIAGGGANIANANYSAIMGGFRGTTRGVVGNHVFPACNDPVAALVGASQAGLLVLGTQTTDATATVLRSTSAAAGTTNQVILPNNAAYFFRGEVIAGVTGGGNTRGWTIEGVIKRGANAASTTLVGTPTVVSSFADAGASTWVIAVTADTTNGGLAVTFTGQAGTTIRVVAQIRTTEMTF